VAGSFVIFVLVIIVVSPTNVTRVGSTLAFNAVQFWKSFNTKVIGILFALLYILIENAMFVLKTKRILYSYAQVVISPWELDVQIFH